MEICTQKERGRCIQSLQPCSALLTGWLGGWGPPPPRHAPHDEEAWFKRGQAHSSQGSSFSPADVIVPDFSLSLSSASLSWTISYSVQI